MAKVPITVLCPSGQRRKAQMTPNGNLLQVLEDMSRQESLESAEWGLKHLQKKCDLTLPWRLTGIPANAQLEMSKLDERRATSDVTVHLQLEDHSRHSGSFQPTVTLREMLDWYRQQPNSSVAAYDNSMSGAGQLHPACSYMSEEIIGDYALSNTSLRELGLTSGAAVIRYQYRAASDDDLKKIAGRIDEKIARRQRPQPVQQQTSNPTPVSPPPTFLPPTTVSAPFYSPMDTTAPAFQHDEYSIFRDRPVSRPTTTAGQRQEPRTLAESLGINIAFDAPSLLQQVMQPPQQTDFSNFKFPEATKGQDLYQSDPNASNQRSRGPKSCDRRTMAYDLSQTASPSTSNTEELPDSFFELTPDDLRSVLTSLRQQSGEEAPLETRTMRERAQSARATAYEHIAIRFVVNSNHVLQGLFYPHETVSTLLEFVRANLVCPHLSQPEFYLYTSPPRVVLSDSKKSLAAHDLVPAAYVYLSHRKVSPLKVELASHVTVGTIDEANQIVGRHVFNRSTTGNADEQGGAQATTDSRPAKRNVTASTLDDKQIRDKFSKFLPGKK